MQPPFDDLREHEEPADSEVGVETCATFVIALFVIVPFTALSPFAYPEPSKLDKLVFLPAYERQLADREQRLRAIAKTDAGEEPEESSADSRQRLARARFDLGEPDFPTLTVR